MAEGSDGGNDAKLSVSRGPAYPYIDLRKAIERTQVVADKGAGRQPMPPESFYTLWGIGAKSSGARMTLAALGYYGLVDAIGKGNGRRAKLTDLARRIVMDQREASPERAAAIRQAALEPPIFRELYERYGHIIPADSVLQSYLMIERGFTKQGAEAATDNYKSTFEFAGLGEPDEKSEMKDSNGGQSGVEYGGARVGDLIDYEAGGAIANREPLRVRALSPDQAWVFVEGSETGLEMEQVIVRERPEAPPQRERPTMPLTPDASRPDEHKVEAGYRSETFDTDEGAIKISWPSNLSSQSVTDMKDWLDLLKRRIERRATTPTTED